MEALALQRAGQPSTVALITEYAGAHSRARQGVAMRLGCGYTIDRAVGNLAHHRSHFSFNHSALTGPRVTARKIAA